MEQDTLNKDVLLASAIAVEIPPESPNKLILRFVVDSGAINIFVTVWNYLTQRSAHFYKIMVSGNRYFQWFPSCEHARILRQLNVMCPLWRI